MIDLERIRQNPTGKRWSIEVLLNLPQLLLMLYGLKCLVTLHGAMPLNLGGPAHNSWHVVAVSGAAAATAGLAYFGFGLFIYLSDGRPPTDSRGWLWPLGRGLLRWGGLAALAFGAFEVDSLVSGRSLNLAGIPVRFLIGSAAFIVGIVALLFFLSATFQREQVKRELADRGCAPLHIWWRPAAYWLPWTTFFGATGFRVVYADAAGFVHKAYCIVYLSFLNDWRWGARRVQWLTDKVSARPLAPEVWVDPEIVRPKLPSSSPNRDAAQ